MPLTGGYGILIRLGLVVVAVVGWSAFWWVKGDQHGTEKLTSYIAKEQVNVIKTIQYQNSVTQQFVTEYVDRVKIIKEKGDEVIRAVPNYIMVESEGGCTIPNGFVVLHNAAAGNGITGTPDESDRTASAFTLTDIALTVAENYESCRLYRQRAWGWAEWYGKLRPAPGR